MIEYYIGYHQNEIKIALLGHAGYAEKGNDIVCAGASMLVQAMACAAQCEGLLLEDKQEDGRELIRMVHTDRTEAWADMLKAGMEMLEATYPEHVGLGRKKQSADDMMTDKEVTV